MAAPVREIVEFWASPSAWTGMLLRRVARDEKAYAAAVAQRLRPFAPRRGYTPSRPESQLRRLGQGWRHPFFNRVQSFVDHKPGRLRIADYRLVNAEARFWTARFPEPGLQLMRRAIVVGGPDGFSDDERRFPLFVSAHALEQFYRRGQAPTGLEALACVMDVWKAVADKRGVLGEFVVPVTAAGGVWRCALLHEGGCEVIAIRTFVRVKPG
jgi:hypothetical protein